MNNRKASYAAIIEQATLINVSNKNYLSEQPSDIDQMEIYITRLALRVP